MGSEQDSTRRLRDATVLLASLARDFAGRYLVRLDSLRPEPADEAFERLKEAARQFVEAERSVDAARGDEVARAEDRANRASVSGRSPQ
jgi:hypothetical protein